MPRSLAMIMNQRCMKRKKLKTAWALLFRWLKGRTVEADITQQGKVCESSASITVYEFITVGGSVSAKNLLHKICSLMFKMCFCRLIRETTYSKREHASKFRWNDERQVHHQIHAAVHLWQGWGVNSFGMTNGAGTSDALRNDEPWNPWKVTFRSRLTGKKSFLENLSQLFGSFVAHPMPHKFLSLSTRKYFFYLPWRASSGEMHRKQSLKGKQKS